mmetsp:Transcript_23421/g.34835  ORF Transcript_23421/g.34835 Transcript_23421/m.34835 type:complete len:454 (+) Transcript_23421:92-1453(+)|eukprot:CAMPEP_0203682520 /NCGR_PEP_ID=MMETSP0090-20130426/46132_1 /ASSEMBLY_ACC=CAM_ASM_001088 /TAXON_ID=426623 /ORGANISM="Chaetoceros affinis, Strain CCMP159" /LENGTH=453 /DNA_ID=CAMNT_0050551487 /DNA_START=87 /DNA_END=1451 /DNA_ORIENTATION=-
MEEKSTEVRISRLRLSLFDLKGDSMSESSASSHVLGPTDDTTTSSIRGACSCPESDLNVGLDLGEDESEYNDRTLDTTLSGERKGVSFGSVSCRFYERTAGLHPAVSSGPALDFSWEYRAVQETSIEEYELHRPTHQRRSRTQMILPRLQRERILQRDCEMSQMKIASYVRRINQTKAQRRQTLNNLRFANIQEKWQKCCRGIKRMLCIQKPYDEELKLLWSNAGKTSAVLERSLGSTSGSTNTETSTESHSVSVSLCCQRKGRKEKRRSELDNGRHRMQFLVESAPSGRSKDHKMLVKRAMFSEDKTLETYDSELDQANHKACFDFSEAESEENQDNTCPILDQTDHISHFQDLQLDCISENNHKHPMKEEEDTHNVKPCALEEAHQDYLDQSRHYHRADHHGSNQHTLDQTRHGIKSQRVIKYDLASDEPFIEQANTSPTAAITASEDTHR